MKARLSTLFFLCIVLTLLFPELGYPQDEDVSKYPSRPITFIIAPPPGASVDVVCRLIIKGAEKYLGQPIIPVNKPGGGFTIATASIASSKPDGYTIGLAAHPGVFTAPHIQKLPYDPLKDLKWVMQFGSMILGVTVKGNSSFKSFKDLIDYARENPNKLIHGTGGIGSFGHIAMEQIARREHIVMSHMPFKGGPNTVSALLGGHVDVMTGDVNKSLLDSGEIRLLLLLTDSHPIDYPQTPILKDLGYDIPLPMILSVSGPKKIPEGIVKKLDEAFTKAMKEEAFIKAMRSFCFTPVYRNSKDLTNYVSRNYEVYGKFLKEMGLAQ